MSSLQKYKAWNLNKRIQNIKLTFSSPEHHKVLGMLRTSAHNLPTKWDRSIYQLFVFHETLAIHVHLGTAFLFKYCISPHNTGHVQTQTYCSNILLFCLKFTIPSRCCIPVLKDNQCYLNFTLLRCPHRIGIA